MPKRSRQRIEVISHGPSCLDGVMAAAAVERFYHQLNVHTRLAANGESDSAIRAVKSRSRGGGDQLWITDLSWTSLETAEHLNALARDGTRIFWIDHHRTAVSRSSAPEFKVAFADSILSEEYSA